MLKCLVILVRKKVRLDVCGKLLEMFEVCFSDAFGFMNSRLIEPIKCLVNLDSLCLKKEWGRVCGLCGVKEV